MFLSLIFILELVANSPAAYAARYTATKSVEIQFPDYNERVPGSWQVDKSGEWVGKGKAKVTFNVDTTDPQQQGENARHKDVLLVLDISDSMNEIGKLDAMKSQVADLIDNLMEDSENRIALVAFCGNVFTENPADPNNFFAWKLTDGFIHDGDTLKNTVSGLSASFQTDYHAAFFRTLEALEGYTQKEDTDLNILFLTDGLPNVNCDLQIGDFKKLKELYPYALVHGIQYELGMGSYIHPQISNVSDMGWSAERTNLYDILYHAAYSSMLYSVVYENFEITDYVNNDLFRVNSVGDIKVDFGTVELEEENGQQKIVWRLDGLLAGKKPKMEINMTVSEGKEGGYDGFFPTNKKEEITYKYPNQSENKITSELTPVLQNYTVHYNANRPIEKADSYDDGHTYKEEPHRAFETVEKSFPEGENCDGYLFKGWKYASNTPDETKNYRGDNFIMPSADVYLNGTWGKFGIKKSMRGEIAQGPMAMFKTGLEVNQTMKELSGYSNPTQDTGDGRIEKFAYKAISGLQGNDSGDIATIKAATGVTDVRPVYDVENSDGHIYMWCEIENGQRVIYWTANTNKVKLNPDSRWFFCNLQSVRYIEDLDKFDSSEAVNLISFFYGCKRLISTQDHPLQLSGFKTPKATKFNVMFCNCSNIEYLDISNMVIHYDASEDGDFYNRSGNMNSMFNGCTNLENLIINDSFTAEARDINRMFYNCQNLKGFQNIVNKIKTDNAVNMSYMFYSIKEEVDELDVSGFNTSNVKAMDGLFYRCSGIKSFKVLDHFDTTNLGVDMGGSDGTGWMFSDCTGLTELDLSSFDTHNVHWMKGMFSGCTNLVTIYASENFVTPDPIYGAGYDYVFNNCTNLVGGAGTAYNGNQGREYARIDDPDNGRPGYFTAKS